VVVGGGAGSQGQSVMGNFKWQSMTGQGQGLSVLRCTVGPTRQRHHIRPEGRGAGHAAVQCSF
jgi:hypothetical protein